MYKILGGDGREYGPVTAEQIRQWMAEGRANAATLIQAEGSTEWKPLAAHPELAALTAAAAPPPSSRGETSAALAETILARGYRVDIGRCVSRGWKLVMENFGLLVGATVVVVFILVAVSVGLRFGVNLARGVTLREMLFARNLKGLRLQWPGILASGLWSALASGPFIGGLTLLYLKRIRNQPATLADAFAGFRASFGQLVLAKVVGGLLTLFGCCFCLLPGIYLGVAWKFALPLVIDKRLRFWEALELSRKVVTREWWMLFALVLLAGLIRLAGVLVCCVGLLVSAPVAFAALLYAYEDIFGQPGPAA